MGAQCLPSYAVALSGQTKCALCMCASSQLIDISAPYIKACQSDQCTASACFMLTVLQVQACCIALPSLNCNTCQCLSHGSCIRESKQSTFRIFQKCAQSSTLMQKAAAAGDEDEEADNEFWNQDFFAEGEQEEDYSAESESADEVDSDFDHSVSEDDEDEAENEEKTKRAAQVKRPKAKPPGWKQAAQRRANQLRQQRQRGKQQQQQQNRANAGDGAAAEAQADKAGPSTSAAAGVLHECTESLPKHTYAARACNLGGTCLCG